MANVGSVTATIQLCSATGVQPTSALVYMLGHAFSGYSDPTTGGFTFDNVPSGSYSVLAKQPGSSLAPTSVSPVAVTSGSTTNIGIIDISNYQTDPANCGSCGNACSNTQTCVSGTCAGNGCATTVAGNTAAAPTSLGALNTGAFVTATGGPLSTASAAAYWYMVTVQNPQLLVTQIAPYLIVENPSSHPKITLTGDTTDYVFDVYENAAGTVAPNCDVGIPSTGTRLWETFYDGAFNSAGAPVLSCPALPNEPQTLFIKVYPITTNPSCGTYTLNISD